MVEHDEQPVEPIIESAAFAPVTGDRTRVPLFGARRRVKELAAEVSEIRRRY